MSSKKIIELDKPRKPPKGRPKNRFVRHPSHWCLPCLTFCDEARSTSKCREEAPMHTMPFPFEDFDCGKYIVVPKKNLDIPRPIIDQVLTLAINKALEAMFGLVDCEIKLVEVLSKEQSSEYIVNFAIIVLGKERLSKTKLISISVDLIKQTVDFL